MPIYKIAIQDEEKVTLDEARDAAEFVQHPKFDTVEIAEASLDVLPESVRQIIALTKRKVLQVGLVRTTKVPFHMHEDDTEFYFGGEDDGRAKVFLEDGDWKEDGDLGPKVVAYTDQGSGHSVEVDGEEPAVFFNVKLGEREVDWVDKGNGCMNRSESEMDIVIDGIDGADEVVIPVRVKVRSVMFEPGVNFLMADLELESANVEHSRLIADKEVRGFYHARRSDRNIINHIRGELPEGVSLNDREEAEDIGFDDPAALRDTETADVVIPNL
jgi:hypothetical protein